MEKELVDLLWEKTYVSHPGIPAVTMFLYRFVHGCRSWPHILVHTRQLLNIFLDYLNFWTNCWPWPINYWIKFWFIFVLTLTLNFQGQMWNSLYLRQYGLIALKQKANISIELKASNVTIGFHIGHNLDLENMEFVISQPKMVHLPRNKNQIMLIASWAFKCDHQVWLWL